MENLKRVAEQIKTMKLTLNGVKLKQTERNDLKAKLVDAIAEDIAEAGLEVLEVAQGKAIVLENDQEGNVVTVFDSVIKNFDYDAYDEAEAYRVEREEKAKKARERAEKTARKRAERKAAAEREKAAEAE